MPAAPSNSPDRSSAADAVIAAARKMAAERLVVGTVGNVSCRRGERILITPTRRGYEDLRAADLAETDLSGRRIGGPHPPSRELPLHLAVYGRRDDAMAIVHTHSPHATAWSFLGETLSPDTEDNAYHGIGTVRTSPPAPPGSAALATVATEALGDSATVLLGRHGILAVGSSPEHALEIARVVEHQAQIAWILRQL